ncbi:MAG: hypothetical protein V1660_00060 [archaeon]
MNNNYCKLVYTECSCYAISKYFYLESFPFFRVPRFFDNSKQIEENNSCEVNSCIKDNVTSICTALRCMRSDERICVSGKCYNAPEIK